MAWLLPIGPVAAAAALWAGGRARSRAVLATWAGLVLAATTAGAAWAAVAHPSVAYRWGGG
jgi:hypothetical protein